MEELQDALEDAQYINAVHDSAPKPTQKWNFLPPEQLAAFIEKTTLADPKTLQLKTICEGSLGFFMVHTHHCLRNFNCFHNCSIIIV